MLTSLEMPGLGGLLESILAQVLERAVAMLGAGSVIAILLVGAAVAAEALASDAGRHRQAYR